MSKRIFLTICWLWSVVGLACCCGCCCSCGCGEQRVTSGGDDEQLFAAAILDASRELSDEDIYDGLIALEYGASPLVQWQIAGADTLVLVASLQGVDWPYSTIEVGSWASTSPATEEVVWVAIPAQVECSLLGEEIFADSVALNRRMIQLLGLRPEGSESMVNLLWVDKDCLLRPSYDPDPTTTHGAVEYPASLEPEWYGQWFEENIAYSYQSPADGLNYPFTRLGYTYDWGEGCSKYGLSEFIITPSSQICLEASVGCWSYYQGLLIDF